MNIEQQGENMELEIDNVAPSTSSFLTPKQTVDVQFLTARTPPPKLPKIVDDKHFSFLRFEHSKSTSAKVIVAECLLCPTTTKPNTVKGDTNTQSNLIKHLKRKHPEAHKEYEKARECPVLSIQPTLSHFRTGTTLAKQVRVDRAITKYVVNSMKPLSTVNDPHFIKLISEASSDSNTPVSIMSRHTLASRLSNMQNETIQRIIQTLKQTKYLCLTADGWSAHSRAFLGVTCHWITKDFKRESAVLACSRFKGSHTYDRISNELNTVISKFEIPKEKIVCVVTDNGSNFVKAFQQFGITSDVQSKTPDSDDELTDEEESGIRHSRFSQFEIEIDGVLKDRRLLSLPPHFRCASHTLSLIATKDIFDAKEKGLYHKVMGRCSKLWSLSSSPKSAEIIIKACGKNFKRPCPTRWNSLYDAIDRLLQMKAGLKTICEQLGVTELGEKELSFLEEFKNVSQSLAYALDLLQGEHGLFMGVTLPALTKMRNLILAQKESTKFCAKFIDACLEGVEKRFGTLLKVDHDKPSDLVYAAMSHPAYKLRWVAAEFHVGLRQQFLLKCEKYAAIVAEAPNLEVSVTSVENPLLDFSDVDQPSGNGSGSDVKYNVEMECIRYFNDARVNVDMLNDYPAIRELFFRYNTSLPSSAPVERLFSYAGMVLSPKRCSLKDKRFEHLVLLKCNSKFQS